MIQSFHHKLMKTHFAMRKRVMKDCKELGLTFGQPKILEYLLENEGVCQKDIAQDCEIEKATVGSILDGMEQIGLVERKRKEGDRRSLFVYLTPAGKKKALEVVKIFDKNEDIAFSNLSKGEKDEFIKILDRIYANLAKKDD